MSRQARETEPAGPQIFRPHPRLFPKAFFSVPWKGCFPPGHVWPFPVTGKRWLAEDQPSAREGPKAFARELSNTKLLCNYLRTHATCPAGCLGN